ncbi:MAG: thymidine phosphorylase [Ignavibacteriaceae bacterium]|nr:thymidine phosphorylase [Ignavibacteriaceae bacterium]
MNTIELIRKKRNGESLSKEEILFLVSSYTKNTIPDYQFSAFLMAVYLKGMNTIETAALTEAMLYSGKVIDLSSIKGIKIDKHSTGGVGDKTSLIIAPIVAAAGINVPMISGRGLGHTGGTLDKLEAIPGYSTNLSLRDYKKVLKKCGLVLIGQTKEIAPADKLIYALRDVTATVESIPLITGSIMSKKLAEGIDGLVLDVKTGSGAFMQKFSDAKALAQSLINTAKAFDKKVIAFITDMNQPLGNYIGNWFEVHESIKILRGEVVPDLCEVSFTLSGAMIYLGGKAKSINEGIQLSKELIANGKAFEKFVELVKLQGGDVSYLYKPEKYPKAKHTLKVKSNVEGFVSSIDTYQIGVAALELGAGRSKKEDVIDPKAGIIFHKKLGDKLSKGEIIAELFTDEKIVLNDAEKRILKALRITDDKPKKQKLIKLIMD